MKTTLRTQRLELRPARDSDLGRLVALVGDYEVSKMLAVVPHPYTVEDGKAWLEKARSGNEAVFVIDDGSGLIGAVGVRDPHGDPSIGYWLGRPFWGMGYMSEAVKAVVDWVFGNTDAARIRSEAMQENPGSLRVQRKLGLVEIGSGTCESRARGSGLPSIRTELTRSAHETWQTRPGD